MPTATKMDLRHTQRLFVTANLSQGATVAATEDQAHYLLHVLRLRPGDVLRMFNGRDGEFRATLSSPGKNKAELTVEEQLRPQTPDADLWLCCAPIKKAHFEYMIEKATELGVCEIQPILTQRTQVREINGNRAYGICREAAEQSDRLSVPAVGNPVDLADLIDVFPKDRAMIVCAEWGTAVPVHEAFHAQELKNFKKAAIVTGPEGGFAAEELEALRKAPNAVFVRLGPRILRADTAAIAALTCWQAMNGDWKGAL
ncbi:MAG: 16S rRNA (uracil(1498)-N(3))-methyltransferase [Alphaproteobacteria bacterium]|nr:16S rRNA (uracil(1498)-N(3))-methyltransferase [Alphaproteobacteria bacterium]